VAQFDERIRKMAQGRFRPSLVSFPHLGEDVPVGVRLLRDSELDECKTAAVLWARQKAQNLGVPPEDLLAIDVGLVQRQIERMILAKAFLDADTLEDAKPRPFFKLPAQVEALDPATIEALQDVYLAHQNAMDPLHGLDEDAVGRLFEELKKASKAGTLGPQLGLYDAATLRALLRISVSLLPD
jgi:hypothetical protein